MSKSGYPSLKSFIGKYLAGFTATFIFFVSGYALETEIDGIELLPLRVEASRQFSDALSGGGLESDWDQRAIERAAPFTLDSVLNMDPAFSTYRRESAAASHPTTQGANLRGLGANAASRTLVLLNGIPQNDPFGGWVTWSRFAPVEISSIEMLPSTSAAVWGNMSAGGIVSLSTVSPLEPRQTFRLGMGGHGYMDASALQVHSRESYGAALSGRILRRDGDFLVHPNDRGSIDSRADLEVDAISVRGVWRVSNQLTLEPNWSYFEEERGNGSPLARNASKGWDLGLTGRGDLGDWFWEASGYYQHREFENVFTSISEDRRSETPVLHQWDLPGEGVGGSVVAATGIGGGHRLMLGADTRRLEGATNEDFGPALSNRRMAGGVQWIHGTFAKAVWQLAESHRLETTLRLDYWRQQDGYLQEFVIGDGVSLRDAQFEDRSDFHPGLAVRWEWQVDPQFELRAGASHAYRLPTINELYRPYRVGADVFDTNPELEPEQFTTVELALSTRPDDAVHFETGVFATRIDDVVANVYIEDGPFQSPAGFVPAAGSYNRRENVDRSQVWGWQNQLQWTASEQVSFRLRHRWLQSEFRKSPVQPALEGRLFPQVPRHAGTLEWTYQPHRKWTFFGALHASSAQFDDPLNQRQIDGYSQADLGFEWDFGRRWTLVGRVDNISDEIILTGVASDGERSIAAGRTAWLTLQADY